MKKLIGVILLAVLLLAACGGGQSAAPPEPDGREPAPAPAPAAPSTLAVIFSNASDYTFNEIYISPTASTEWGDELLGSTRILKSNGSIDVEVPAYEYENYDILVVDEDRDQYHFTYVPLQHGSEVAIYFGEEGLAADVADPAGNMVATVFGQLNGGSGGGGQGDAGGGNVEEPVVQQPVVTGTGNDTNGQYTFSVYNESAYDIYSIHMGILGASAEYDIDILPQILPAGSGAELVGMASQGDWLNTEWTLYITDVDGDTSASFDSFNPWTVSYVDIYWDSESQGYVCEFFY